MSDVARYLPLSQRPPVDESGVSGDWRPLIAEGLSLVTDMLETLSPEQWDRDSLCAGWRVRDVAGHLVWWLGSSLPAIVTGGLRTIVRDRVSPLRLTDVEARRAGDADPAAILRSLRAIAAARAAGTGRAGVGDLAEVVVHGYDIGRAVDYPLAFPARATGAVALARSLAAPMPVRAVVRHRSLRATDAGWTVGHGAEIAAPAEALLLFLYGRTGMPPRLSPGGTTPAA